jgi:hypothetical protein
MSDIEQRIRKLEMEMEVLKGERSESRDLAAKKRGWIEKITGTFENDPEFDEILRLGREERKSDMLNSE